MASTTTTGNRCACRDIVSIRIHRIVEQAEFWKFSNSENSDVDEKENKNPTLHRLCRVAHGERKQKDLLKAKSKIDFLTNSNFIKMADFPYATVTGKMSDFFKKIKGIGVPTKVDIAWLRTVGYTSSNDRSLIPVLKIIDFIDTSGVPTDKWRRYRSSDAALGEGIKQGYKELFDLYPDAQKRSKNELSSFFKSKSNAGDQAIAKTITTFNNLCELADFSSEAESSVAHSQKQEDKPHPSSHKQKDTGVFTRSVDAGNNVTININVQLTIPETKDETIYEKFFSAMKKHLLSN